MYERLIQKIVGKKFYFILIDGVIDLLVIENKFVFVRLVNCGVLENYYFSIEDIQNVNVYGILNCIEKLFERIEIVDWKLNFVGFGLDGVLVNLGFKGGVVVLLKNEVFYLISVYCIVYRLELVVNNVIKSQIIMKDI